MSARQPRNTSSSSEGEEQKKSVDEAVKDMDLEDEAALRILRKKLPWREWLMRDFFRYWYWFAALVVDVFVPWAISDALVLWKGLGPIVVIAMLVGLFVGEVLLYRRIWPEGPWMTGGRRRRKKFLKGPGLLDRLLRRED